MLSAAPASWADAGVSAGCSGGVVSAGVVSAGVVSAGVVVAGSSVSSVVGAAAEELFGDGVTAPADGLSAGRITRKVIRPARATATSAAVIPRARPRRRLASWAGRPGTGSRVAAAGPAAGRSGPATAGRGAVGVPAGKAAVRVWAGDEEPRS